MIHLLTLHQGLEWLPVWLKQAKKHAMLDYKVHLGVDYPDSVTDETFENIIKEHDEIETIMKRKYGSRRFHIPINNESSTIYGYFINTEYNN